ncbi:MAG TPA: cyclic nucleotide-binding domain-containing protein [Thermoanaerobaculia bacterium]|nr:cyclic nucleotide-binding domain-containing protein [Thermoanaerobaculia bacterium]
MKRSGLPPSLSSLETIQNRVAGETLFLEGEHPAGLYVLHSGEVELLFAAHDGRPRPLRLVSPGAILGLSPVVMGRAHDCSATTRTDCRVGIVAAEDLLHTLAERPEAWLQLLRLLSSDVNAAYEDLRLLAS